MVMPSEYQIQFRHLISQLVIIWISHVSECDHHVTSILYFQDMKVPSCTIYIVFKDNLVHFDRVKSFYPRQLCKSNEADLLSFMFHHVVQLSAKERLHL